MHVMRGPMLAAWAGRAGPGAARAMPQPAPAPPPPDGPAAACEAVRGVEGFMGVT